MKALILAAFIALGLNGSLSQAAEIDAYHAPAHNYYHNNWRSG